MGTFRWAPLILTLALPAAALAEPEVEVLATGLDNPRGIAITPDGRLLVAEAGTGGEGPCFIGPEGEVCFGSSGAVTEIKGSSWRRIAEGLPSFAAPDGSSAVGPSDVSVLGNGNTYVTLGLGGDLDLRDGLGADAAVMGSLLRLRQWSGDLGVVADLAAFEEVADPDGFGSDSNPNGVAAAPAGQAVADAGANALLSVKANGDVSVLATFPARMVFVPFLGLNLPMQAVPTSVAMGPDGAWYVGELTGFPFPPGYAQVWRVDPEGEATVFADGFTNIIGLDFGPDGSLYVLEIATNGLLSGDLTGGLWEIDPEGNVASITTDLFAPGGIAAGEDGTLYVSNCSVCAGGGMVLGITP